MTRPTPESPPNGMVAGDRSSALESDKSASRRHNAHYRSWVETSRTTRCANRSLDGGTRGSHDERTTLSRCVVHLLHARRAHARDAVRGRIRSRGAPSCPDERALPEGTHAATPSDLPGQLGLRSVQVLVEQLRNLSGHRRQSRAHGRSTGPLDIQLVPGELQILIELIGPQASLLERSLRRLSSRGQLVQDCDDSLGRRDHCTVDNQQLACYSRRQVVLDSMGRALRHPGRDRLTRAEKRGFHAHEPSRVPGTTAVGAPNRGPSRRPHVMLSGRSGTDMGTAPVSSQVNRILRCRPMGRQRDVRCPMAAVNWPLWGHQVPAQSHALDPTRRVGRGPALPLPHRPILWETKAVPPRSPMGRSGTRSGNAPAGATPTPESRPGGPPRGDPDRRPKDPRASENRTTRVLGGT